MSLPELVVFSIKVADQEEARYLSFTGPQRQLRCGNEDGVYSDTARFAVEPAANGLVHIRSCFENHYWVRASRFDPWLLASSPEAVDDISNDGCTLFRPRMSAGNVFVGFVHVQSGLNVVMRPATDAYAFNLSVERGAPTDFNYVDYAPLTRIKLPRYIMFLGHNDKYLNTRMEENSVLVLMHFHEFDSPTDRTVVFEVMYAKNGDIRVKSILYNAFWETSEFSYWLLIDYLGLSDSNVRTYLYEVVFSSSPNIGGEVGVALRCRGYDRYCCRINFLDGIFIVGATSPNDENAWIRPRHAAHQDKRVVNIESFRHAWLAPKSSLFLLTRRFSNTTDVAQEHSIPLTIRLSTRNTFNSSIGFFKGPPALFNGRMPFNTSSGKLEFPDVETSIKADWGTIEYILGPSSNKHEVEVIVPPKTLVIVNVFMVLATYEVPFSYEQVDEFPFGGTVTQHLNDGVFTIQSQYDVETTRTHAPLLSSSESDVQEGLELVGAPGIFEYKISEEQGRIKVEDNDPRPESNDDQVADALGGIKLDASDPGNQE